MEHDWSWWMREVWAVYTGPPMHHGSIECKLCTNGIVPIGCCSGGSTPDDFCGCMGMPVDFTTCPNGCPWPYNYITYPFLIQIG